MSITLITPPGSSTPPPPSSNSFETIQTPSGTSPVADSSTDTLTLTAGTHLTITGNSTTDTVAFDTDATASNTASTIVARTAGGLTSLTGIRDSTDVLAVSADARTLNNDAGTSVLGFGDSSPSQLEAHADLVLDYGRVIGIYAPPTTIVGIDSGSSGTIPDGTYAYKMTAVINGEETIPGIASFVVLSDGGTNSALVRVNILVGASSYRYYRATNPALVYGFLGTNNSGAGYFDDGSVTPDTGMPPPSTSLAKSVRVDATTALLGDITGGGLNLITPLNQIIFNDSGFQGIISAPGAGVLIGSSSGDFNFYSSGAGLQFGANGGVNLYGTGGFNLSVGPGSTAYFHGNNSGLEFNFDGTSLLYSTKFQLNMVGGSEIFEADVTTGVKVWDSSGTISADLQERHLNASSSQSILDFSNSTRGLVTPESLSTTGSSTRIATTYQGTPFISLGSQTNGGSLSDTVTYYWVMTAVIQGAVETIASNEVSFTMASPDLTQELSGSAIPGATEYRLYRGTSPGVYDGYYYIDSPANGVAPAFIDDGTTSPVVQQPPITSLAPSSYMSNVNGIFTMQNVLLFGNLQLGGLGSQITDSNGSSFIDVPNRILKSQVGGDAIVFDQTERQLKNLGGGNSAIFGAAGYTGVGFPNDVFKNSDNTLSASTENRTLVGASGIVNVDWTGDGIKLNPITSGTATLVGGTITVSTTAVAANSIIMLTIQNGSGLDSVSVSGRNVGTDFTITSSNVLDTSDVGWFIIQQ